MLHLILLIMVIYAVVRLIVPFFRRPRTREGLCQIGQGINTMSSSAVDMYRERRAEHRARRDNYARYRPDF